MSKKTALLVTATLTTRVIVDVPDNYNPTEDGNVLDDFDGDLLDKIVDEATDGIVLRLRNSELAENVTGIRNDIECPYDETDPKDNPQELS